MYPKGGFLPSEKTGTTMKVTTNCANPRCRADTGSNQMFCPNCVKLGASETNINPQKESDMATLTKVCSGCGKMIPHDKDQCFGCANGTVPRTMPQHYSQQRWNSLLEDTIKEINKLATAKGGEYAGDEDRLANFRRNGLALGLPMETVWAVYAGKHWDAIQQYIKDTREGKARERLEPIGGRVDDLLVYLLLLKAMLDERGAL